MIFFIGMPSSGKSTFGYIYSILYKNIYYDFDYIIYKIYNLLSENFFLFYNNNRVFRLYESTLYLFDRDFIYSLGGGIILIYNNIIFLIKKYLLLFYIFSYKKILNRNIMGFYNYFYLSLERLSSYFFLYNIFLLNE